MSSSPARDANVSPDGTAYPVDLGEAQWKAKLTGPEYDVLRKAGTEPAFRGEYTDTKTRGTYSCRACGSPLFSSVEKFDSHCGWPSFFTPLAGDSVVLIKDRSSGMTRVEARCANCGSHLGHVFSGEGYGGADDQRWCINSISISLETTDR